MHYLYIIYSSRIDHYYIGETMDMERRLEEHNGGVFKGCFTRRSNDWHYVLTIPFSEKSRAQQAECFVKRMNSRKFTERLILEHDQNLRIRYKFLFIQKINSFGSSCLFFRFRLLVVLENRQTNYISYLHTAETLFHLNT